jgi:hypothetical protein
MEFFNKMPNIFVLLKYSLNSRSFEVRNTKEDVYIVSQNVKIQVYYGINPFI